MTAIVHKRMERCWFDIGQLTALRYFAFYPLVSNFQSGLKNAGNFVLCFKEITLKTLRKDARIFGRIFFEKLRSKERNSRISLSLLLHNTVYTSQEAWCNRQDFEILQNLMTT